MFKTHKEIIWHLTCNICKYYFTIATMEEKWSPTRGFVYCPGCGRKQTVEHSVTNITQSDKNKK